MEFCGKISKYFKYFYKYNDLNNFLKVWQILYNNYFGHKRYKYESPEWIQECKLKDN